MLKVYVSHLLLILLLRYTGRKDPLSLYHCPDGLKFFLVVFIYYNSSIKQSHSASEHVYPHSIISFYHHQLLR
jgi:hypothetical protein